MGNELVERAVARAADMVEETSMPLLAQLAADLGPRSSTRSMSSEMPRLESEMGLAALGAVPLARSATITVDWPETPREADAEGETTAAKACCVEALDALESSGASEAQADCLRTLAAVPLQRAQPPADEAAAKACCLEALEAPLESSKASEAQADCLRALAAVPLQRAEPPVDEAAAKACCLEALEAPLESSGVSEAQADCLRALAAVPLQRAEPPADAAAAKACCLEALESLLESSGVSEAQADCLRALGAVPLQRADPPADEAAAKACCLEALESPLESTGASEAQADCLRALAAVPLQRAETPADEAAAKACCLEALESPMESSGASEAQADCLRALGAVPLQMAQAPSATRPSVERAHTLEMLETPRELWEPLGNELVTGVLARTVDEALQSSSPRTHMDSLQTPRLEDAAPLDAQPAPTSLTGTMVSRQSPISVAEVVPLALPDADLAAGSPVADAIEPADLPRREEPEGETTAAKACCLEAVVALESSGASEAQADCLRALSAVPLQRAEPPGDEAAAKACCLEALESPLESSGASEAQADCLRALAAVPLQRAEPPADEAAAKACCLEALESPMESSGASEAQADCLRALGAVPLQMAQAPSATRPSVERAHTLEMLETPRELWEPLGNELVTGVLARTVDEAFQSSSPRTHMDSLQTPRLEDAAPLDAQPAPTSLTGTMVSRQSPISVAEVVPLALPDADLAAGSPVADAIEPADLPRREEPEGETTAAKACCLEAVVALESSGASEAQADCLRALSAVPLQRAEPPGDEAAAKACCLEALESPLESSGASEAQADCLRALAAVPLQRAETLADEAAAKACCLEALESPLESSGASEAQADCLRALATVQVPGAVVVAADEAADPADYPTLVPALLPVSLPPHAPTSDALLETPRLQDVALFAQMPPTESCASPRTVSETSSCFGLGAESLEIALAAAVLSSTSRPQSRPHTASSLDASGQVASTTQEVAAAAASLISTAALQTAAMSRPAASSAPVVSSSKTAKAMAANAESATLRADLPKPSPVASVVSASETAEDATSLAHELAKTSALRATASHDRPSPVASLGSADEAAVDTAALAHELAEATAAAAATLALQAAAAHDRPSHLASSGSADQAAEDPQDANALAGELARASALRASMPSPVTSVGSADQDPQNTALAGELTEATALRATAVHRSPSPVESVGSAGEAAEDVGALAGELAQDTAMRASRVHSRHTSVMTLGGGSVCSTPHNARELALRVFELAMEDTRDFAVVSVASGISSRAASSVGGLVAPALKVALPADTPDAAADDEDSAAKARCVGALEAMKDSGASEAQMDCLKALAAMPSQGAGIPAAAVEAAIVAPVRVVVAAADDEEESSAKARCVEALESVDNNNGASEAQADCRKALAAVPLSWAGAPVTTAEAAVVEPVRTLDPAADDEDSAAKARCVEALGAAKEDSRASEAQATCLRALAAVPLQSSGAPVSQRVEQAEVRQRRSLEAAPLSQQDVRSRAPGASPGDLVTELVQQKVHLGDPRCGEPPLGPPLRPRLLDRGAAAGDARMPWPAEHAAGPEPAAASSAPPTPPQTPKECPRPAPPPEQHAGAVAALARHCRAPRAPGGARGVGGVPGGSAAGWAGPEAPMLEAEVHLGDPRCGEPPLGPPLRPRLLDRGAAAGDARMPWPAEHAAGPEPAAASSAPPTPPQTPKECPRPAPPPEQHAGAVAALARHCRAPRAPGGARGVGGVPGGSAAGWAGPEAPMLEAEVHLGDPRCGVGPIADQIASQLAQFVSVGDMGVAAVAPMRPQQALPLPPEAPQQPRQEGAAGPALPAQPAALAASAPGAQQTALNDMGAGQLDSVLQQAGVAPVDGSVADKLAVARRIRSATGPPPRPPLGHTAPPPGPQQVLALPWQSWLPELPQRTSVPGAAAPPGPQQAMALPWQSRLPELPQRTSVPGAAAPRQLVKMAPQAKGNVTSANGDNAGPLKNLLTAECPGRVVVALQEHHAAAERIPQLERGLADLGWRGFLAPAITTGAGSTTGGVGIVARSDIGVKAAPAPAAGWQRGLQGALEPGRLAAAHVMWGPEGDANVGLLRSVAQYVAELTQLRYDWMAIGDWNMTPEELPQRWVSRLGGVIVAPSEPTCSKTLPGRIAFWQRIPVAPAPLPPVRPGCPRPPPISFRAATEEAILCAGTNADLQECWDAVLQGIESELLDRWDLVDGDARARYEGRAGEPMTKWARLRWQPPRRRLRSTPELLAWTSVASWAKHVLRAKAHLLKLMRHAEQQPRAAVPGLAKNIGAFLSFLNRILRAGHVWASVPKEVLDLFSLGLDLLLLPDLDQRMGQLVVQHSDLQTKFRGEVAKRWKGWLDEAFANGATGAHRATRLQERLEFISAPNSVQPFELADQAMDEWEDLWTSPGAPWTQLPGDAASWAQLPTIDGAAVREALLTFSWRTAVAVTRLRDIADQVTPRALMDDLTMQWVGDAIAGGTLQLHRAVAEFIKDVRPLGMHIKRAKSGWLGTTTAVQKDFRASAAAPQLPERRSVRNLGHDTHGRAASVRVVRRVRRGVRRPVAQARMDSLAARKQRIDALFRGAGVRAQALRRTGLLPSAAHGAAVGGIADAHLGAPRHRAALLCSGRGGIGADSIAVHLATQTDQYMDPMYEATLAPVCRYSAAVWDGHLALSRLQQAWAVLQQRWRECKPTWHGIRGPVAAAWMSLLRIDWSMHSSLVLVDDEGRAVELLRTHPKEVAALLREGVRRWQGRQILQHHQEVPPPPGARIWMRAVRRALAPPAAKLRGARAGHLRMLWAGASWDLAKRKALHYVASARCPFCPDQEATGTRGHWFYERQRVAAMGSDEQGPMHEMTEQMAKTKQRMKDRCHLGVADADYDRFDLVVGIPMVPCDVPAPSAVRAIRYWGDWSSPINGRTTITYSDGSGFDSAIPEITRLLITDLAGLAKEVNDWDAELAGAAGQYADIWRQIFDAAADQGGLPRPAATWCPAHLEFEEFVQCADLDPMDYLGNAWADWFAKVGALERKLPDALADLFRARLADAHEEAAVLAWHQAALGALAEDARALVQRVHRPAAPVAPAVLGHRHQLQRGPAGWRCTECLATATTEAARRRRLDSSCEPSALQGMMDAIAIAMRAADRVLGSVIGHPGPVAARTWIPVRPAADFDEFASVGWSVVALQPDADCYLASVAGQLCGAYVDINGGELMAVIMALRFSMGVVTLVVDSKYVYDGFYKDGGQSVPPMRGEDWGSEAAEGVRGGDGAGGEDWCAAGAAAEAAEAARRSSVVASLLAAYRRGCDAAGLSDGAAARTPRTGAAPRTEAHSGSVPAAKELIADIKETGGHQWNLENQVYVGNLSYDIDWRVPNDHVGQEQLLCAELLIERLLPGFLQPPLSYFPTVVEKFDYSLPKCLSDVTVGVADGPEHVFPDQDLSHSLARDQSR
ncbi:unnamed protein product [Prorocentrum cordatum]|uniref:Uncharacterized protein n=1 Tax=Prorocentrum cordatum TaxID=2364126 RepID=A0ABN9Y332_9DINO|nr:unnamed protein product [Polarella glacialis]